MVADSRPEPGAYPELTAAAAHARRWLDGLAGRPIPARVDAASLLDAMPERLPGHGIPPRDVVDDIVGRTEPGLMASQSGRFYGWVMGGTLPAALAADWLVSAWDQNAGMRDATPGVVALEDAAGRWLLDVLGLPSTSAVGFTTGATMANFTGLAAARDAVLARSGWSVAERGLIAAPPVRVLAGAERHGSIDMALRYLGLGEPELVAADEQGRIDPAALRAALVGSSGPTILCLQAGNVHSGAFDPFTDPIAAAHDAGAWVHVDGAFGLWAAATPSLSALTAGMAGADSWATDAHKTLNVPYDCGVAIVADPAAMVRAFGHRADYLIDAEIPDPHEHVPELSRRARGVPVYAALASLGRDGVRGLVDGLVTAAQAIRDGLAELPGATIVNDVVYTQVCVAFEDDQRTTEVLDRLLAEGVVRPSPSRWRDRAIIRISVSNWQTAGDEVRDTVAAFQRARA
ncbi:MAG TPA: pyridoxal-dependent decarboxylase [Pseudolysinimonas sp.]|jgi:glutamate/tyrosine decarboxylase-like PLP-dependent enzyme|nr:pyridoxal-dependent decarboxylase [Pseudolysinimonas sp.]